MTLGRLARGVVVAALAATVVATGAWCSLAVWFRFPGSEPVRALLSGAVAGFALAAVVHLAMSKRRAAPAVYAALVALIVAGWASITPMNDRDWAPDVARSATASIEGKRLTITNVRDFAWRSETDFDQRWDQRSYDLLSLTDVDLIMSYWAGEAIAHTILSFRFADGGRIAFSIETRKQSEEPYSALAGFFKQYELAIVAADERDVVRVRSNIRGEDVRIYRLRIAPERARSLL